MAKILSFIFLGTFLIEAIVIFCHIGLQGATNRQLIKNFMNEDDWYRFRISVQSFMQLLATAPLLMSPLLEILSMVHSIKAERQF